MTKKVTDVKLVIFVAYIQKYPLIGMVKQQTCFHSKQIDYIHKSPQKISIFA